jgi:hypothetical protein
MPGQAAPGLAREKAAWARGRLLFGIDEVGRGPLAVRTVRVGLRGAPAVEHPLFRRRASPSAAAVKRRDGFFVLGRTFFPHSQQQTALGGGGR